MPMLMLKDLPRYDGPTSPEQLLQAADSDLLAVARGGRASGGKRGVVRSHSVLADSLSGNCYGDGGQAIRQAKKGSPMSDKPIALVTRANKGIGLQIAKALRHGASPTETGNQR